MAQAQPMGLSDWLRGRQIFKEGSFIQRRGVTVLGLCGHTAKWALSSHLACESWSTWRPRRLHKEPPRRKQPAQRAGFSRTHTSPGSLS